MVEILKKSKTQPINIIGGGGLSRIPISNEIKSSITGLPYYTTKEIEITALNKQTLVIARNGKASELFPIGFGQISDRGSLISAVEFAVSQAWPDNVVSDSYLVPANDVYGNLREGSLGEETLRLILDDADETWIHVNLTDGDLISVMDDSRRIYRWLFNGIHSLDLPGLVNHKFIWSLLMVLLMSVGLIFCITGIVLAFKKITKMVIR